MARAAPLLLLLTALTFGDTYLLPWSSTSSGGAPGTGYGFALDGSAGLAVQGTGSGTGYELSGGFWVYEVLLALDVGTDCIFRPVASFLLPSWKIPPLVRIKNYGTTSTGPFNARFSISPGSYSPSTKAVASLGPGDTVSVMFDSLTLESGVFTARCTTLLSGDQNQPNDARTALFQGCNFVDFFDLTDGGLIPNPDPGYWERGVPVTPWTWPPMDSFVWGNRVSGYYDNDENSFLTSPKYTATQNNPAIAFQHSFNTEWLHDGGNFLYTTDGGENWTRLPIFAGVPYNSAVAALGDSGWSGGSSGWDQSIATIPVSDDDTFRVRWRFASDGTETGRGWLLDEVAGIGCSWGVGQRPPQHDTFALTLKVSFNPLRGVDMVSYTLPAAGNVSIKLYDITGSLAARLFSGPARQGMNTAKLDTRRLASGVYFVKLVCEGETRTVKLTIQ